MLPEFDPADDVDDLAARTSTELAQGGATGVRIEPLGETRIVTGTSADGLGVEVAVRVAPWTPQAADALVAWHYQDGRAPQVLATVGPEPPFAVAYLYESGAWSSLESRLYADFADPALDPLDPGPYLQRARTVLELALDDADFDVATLDRVLDGLPRPTASGSEYVPIATLVAIGLVLGEEVRHAHPRLEWVPGADAMARYFALRDRHDDGRLFRPIDFVVQAYRAPIDGGLTAYAELVDVRMAN